MKASQFAFAGDIPVMYESSIHQSHEKYGRNDQYFGCVHPWTLWWGKSAGVNANFDAHHCQIQALKAAFCQEHPTASICQ